MRLIILLLLFPSFGCAEIWRCESQSKVTFTTAPNPNSSFLCKPWNYSRSSYTKLPAEQFDALSLPHQSPRARPSANLKDQQLVPIKWRAFDRVLADNQIACQVEVSLTAPATGDYIIEISRGIMQVDTRRIEGVSQKHEINSQVVLYDKCENPSVRAYRAQL